MIQPSLRDSFFIELYPAQIMNSFRTITLFTETPPSRRGPSSFLVSILFHAIAIGVIALSLRYTPRVDQSFAQRYTVRYLNLHKTEAQRQRAIKGGVEYSARRAVARAGGGRPAAAPSVPRQLAQLVPAPQTLVQPDLPPNLLLPKETPIPLVVLWSPENIPVKKIVPTPPKITAIKVRPSLQVPNRELNPADIKISASAFSTETPAPLPSTTSPVVVRAAAAAKQVPQTTPKAPGLPAPARVMSLSDLQMREGTVTIPLANETATASLLGSLDPGKLKSTSEPGNGSTANKQKGNGAGQSTGANGRNETASSGPAGQIGQMGQSGAKTGSEEGLGAGLELGSERSLVHISLPENGQFGVVVVGASLAEEYPETLGLWSGRLAYTVYLRVGLAKSWILQYCLPSSGQTATAGSVVRPDAPWPYEIVRPRLAPGDLDADAVMVHGFVNTAGRFEHLAIVFPPQFTQTKFVLSALEQWHFRPAVQNGQIAAVEVLLIIPDDQE